jgi:hypothetical protein
MYTYNKTHILNITISPTTFHLKFHVEINMFLSNCVKAENPRSHKSNNSFMRTRKFFLNMAQ